MLVLMIKMVMVGNESLKSYAPSLVKLCIMCNITVAKLVMD